jgi:hypothetical protein
MDVVNDALGRASVSTDFTFAVLAGLALPSGLV